MIRPITAFRHCWLAALLLLTAGRAAAQVPVLLGTGAVNGTYQSYTLATVGGFKQYRLQASSTGSARTWEFYSNVPSNYFYNWRPYAVGQTLAGFNQLIDPTAVAASARYNTNSGGASGVLPTITGGRYYTFNVANSTGNYGTAGSSGYGSGMAVLETIYNPVTVTAVTNPGQAHGQSATITATTSAPPNAAEYLWLRYTTDNFTTSSTVLMTGSGTSWSGVIPAQPLTATVKYYVLTSPVNTGVSNATADMLTLNVNNNAGANYTLAIGLCGTYTVDPAGAGANNYTTLGAAIAALNTYGVGTGCTGGVTFSVKDGAVFSEQNLQLNTFTNAGNRTVTFQRDNSGATRPKVQPAVGFSTGGTQDAIIKLNGADLVTFDGIDVAENPANTGANKMEYGYALFRASATNACQLIGIRNCAVTLDKTNPNLTVGIYGALTDASGAATSVTTGTTTGIGRDVKINGCTIGNAYYGIWLNGGTGSQQADQGGEIGTTTGNILSNLGDGTLNGSGAPVYGIRVEGFAGVKVENNTITLNTSGTAATYGIGLGVGTPGSTNTTALLTAGGAATVSTNNVRLTTITTGAAYCIYQATQNLTGATFANNTFQSCSIVGAAGGGFIRDDTSSGNSQGTSMTGNTVGGSAGTANTVTLAPGYVFYGLFCNGVNVANGILSESFSNNVMRYNTFGGTSFTGYGIGRTTVNQASVNVTISNNQVSNNTIGTTTSFNALMTPGLSNRTLTVSNNMVQNNTCTGAGMIFYGINHFLLYAPATGTISSNLIDGNQLTGGGAAKLYAIYGGVGAAFNVTGNTITNNAITNAASGAAFYGCYYNYALPSGTNFQTYANNVITDNSISATGTASVAMYGISLNGGNANQTSTVTGNTIGNLTIGSSGSTTVTGTIRGIQVENSTLMTIRRNKVYGLTAYGTAGSVTGIYTNMISSVGTANAVTQNVVGGLAAPASTDANAVNGLQLVCSTAATMQVYHNTIWLTGTGGASFGANGILLNNVYYNAVTPVYDLRNNLIQNLCTSTSGIVAALRNYQSTNAAVAPANIATTSDNNLYYAGTPATRNVLYVEGATGTINQYPFLAGYQQLVQNRELNSRTGVVTFAATTGSSAQFLRLTTGVSQPAESMGQVIATETTDIDGDLRFGAAGYSGTGTAPDAGADEVAATPVDLTGPMILYPPLGRQIAAPGPTLSVTITDASGVNTTAGTKPRLYYKLSTNADQVNTNTSASVGWKYVEASNATSPFTFTIDYSKLPTAPVLGNTIQYVVVAQDLAATPNVSANASVFFASQPTSVALATANFPVASGNGGGTVRSYVIGAGLSGTVLVGAGQTYTTLTGAGGLFAALNAGVLTGNLTALITSDILTEPGAIKLDPISESPASSNFSVSIQPSAPTLRTLSFPSSYFFINGADRVTFDGRFNQTGPATDKYLRFRNANGNMLFEIRQDATYLTIRNCILEGGQPNASYGTIYLTGSTQTPVYNGVVAGLTGNSNFTLLNCDVRDRSDAVSTPGNAVVSVSGGGTLPTNDYVTISGCNFYNFSSSGISVTNGGSNWTIGGATAAEGNSFYTTNATTNAATMISAALTATSTNWVIRNNFLGGNAAGATGTYTYGNNGIFTGIAVSGGGAATAGNVQVRDNVIRNISQTNTGTSTYFRGISVISSTGYQIADNTITNITSAGSFQWYQGGFMYIPNGNTAGIYVNDNSLNQLISGNTVSNIGLTFSGATPTTFAGIAAFGGTVNVSRNRVYGLTNVNPTASSAATGLYFFSCNPTVTNNQISITNGANTNELQVYGILDWTLNGGTFYYNSVYIGGSQAAGTSYHSYGYRRANQNAITLRNNLFLNERTSTGAATAKHFAAGVTGGNGLLTSNYNDFWAATAANQCEAGGVALTLATWRTTIGGDANSKNVRPRYVDTSVGNLNLDASTNCQLDGAGQAVAGFDGEFDNAATSRQTTPDIGADEFSYGQSTVSFATASPACGISTASISLGGNGGPWSVTYTDGTTPVTVNSVATSPLSIAVTVGKTYTITSATDAYGCTLGVTGGSLVIAPATTLGTANPDPALTGATVTITGTGLLGATAVMFNGTAASFTVNSATQITATVPTGATTGPLTVTNRCGTIYTIAPFTIVNDLVISTTGQTIPAGTYNNINITGTGAATLGGPVTVSTAFLVQSGGALATACQPLTGAGTFTLEAGATLGVCDTAGLRATANTGAVRVTGTRSFSADALYAYNGTLAQVTGDGLPATVRSLSLSNAAGLTLSHGLTTTQSVTLTSGVLTTGSAAITLGSAATISELETAYVLGTVQTTRSLSTAGSGSSFGGLGVTLTPDAASAALPGSTQVVRTTGTAPTGMNSSVGIKRCFAITPTVDFGLDVLLELRYFDHELNGIPEARLLLFKSDAGPTGPWTRVDGATYNSVTNTIARDHIANFSFWTLGDATNPLPVELTRFAAQRSGPDALLHWASASERNSAGFEVQVSVDGRDFRRLAFVASPSANSAAVRQYEYRDTEPEKTRLRYYRLRQVDLDGTAQYSPIVAIAFKPQAAALTLAAFPNPLSNAQTLRLVLTGWPTDQPLTLTLTDAMGRTVWRSPAMLSDDAPTLSLPTNLMGHLPIGSYTLLATSNSGQACQVVVMLE